MRRKKIKRKKTGVVLLFSIGIVLAGIFVLDLMPKITGFFNLPAANAQNTVSASNQTEDKVSDKEPTDLSQVATKEDVELPQYSPPKDASYLLLNLKTGERILEKDPQLVRAPASTVKLLTGLVVYDKLQEEQLLTLGEEVREEGSILGLKPGDTILVKELYKAMYVMSANDAANALAVAAFGNMEEFIKAMNQYAQELGCENSQFLTANGMPAQDQYTTAADMARIAAKFIKNQDLMEYVKLKEATVTWTDANGYKQVRELSNTNLLLGLYPGDSGLKTGTTTEAGQCLITYVSNPDGDLLLVLLGSKQRYKDTVALLDQGIAKIRSRSALKNIYQSPDRKSVV